MQIVIELTDKEKEMVDNSHKAIFINVYNMMANKIKNGTLLPKHGRLIDADALKYSFELSDFDGDPNDCIDAANYIVSSAPTILEANKEKLK